MTGFSGQKSAYNESGQSQVTVTVTLSNDGIPIEGTDGTALSHLKVTVPYFDLGLYGLITVILQTVSVITWKSREW